MLKLITFLLLSVGALAQAPVVPVAPVWFKVAAGGDTITAAKGMTFRYGAYASTYVFDCSTPLQCGTHKAGDASAEAWSKSVTVAADGTFLAGDDFFGGDPDYDVYKEIDIEETASPQTVTVTPANGSGAITVTVPALAPPSALIPVPSGLAMGCYSGLVTSKDAGGNAVQEYFYILCANPPAAAQ